jgi:apolipoprotein N-acyltransferase
MPRRSLLDGQIDTVWPLLALSAMTFGLSFLLFEPLTVWPVGYLVFVPWLIAVCAGRSRVWVYVSSYLLGLAFFLSHWRWLFETTPEGYFTGGVVWGLYFPLAAWIVRHLYRRRGLGAAVSFPFVWVGIEIIRSHGPLAFPWFLLGHSQIGLLSMIQIADVTGVYGVTFVLAAVNGWLSDAVLARLRARSGAAVKMPGVAPTVGVITLVGVALMYGWFRLAQMQPTSGPQIAVLQGDYALSADPNVPGAPERDKWQAYMRLMDRAAESQPDLVVLPETPWSMYLNRELREQTADLLERLDVSTRDYVRAIGGNANFWHQRFEHYARQHDSFVVVGGMSYEPKPAGSYPSELRYNSAFVYAPQTAEPARYDKIHLVLFGEYVPFRYWDSLHWFYRWLNDNMTPFGQGGFEYSLSPGKDFRIFDMHPRSEPSRDYHFAITICYEDVIPQVFRRFTVDADGRKRVDFMLNISNDGWFGHGSQQAQHLVNCAFRAVENRVGIARSVNTGISGFVQPDGSWHNLVGQDGSLLKAGGQGLAIDRVWSDPRPTFYALHGDAFGIACTMLAAVGAGDAARIAWREKRKRKRRKPAESKKK